MGEKETYFYKATFIPSGKIYSCFVASSFEQAEEYINTGFPDKARDLEVSCIHSWPESAWVEYWLEGMQLIKYRTSPISIHFEFFEKFREKLYSKDPNKDDILKDYYKYLELVGPNDPELFDVMSSLKSMGLL